ncbi:MAG TPA: PDZ domain-containing protein [Gemmatimonadaceae bacterium]|nr:PDZ domain-containing protein [Gemmatimonadaceae bacterium]
MRLHSAIVSTLVLAASTAGAQVAIATPRGTARAVAPAAIVMDGPRAVIGVSTSFGTGSRDTLGLLVSAVTRNGPAEKAGIEEGNRIAMINGVSLRLAAADLGDPDMQRLMNRRLIRELDKVKPGDEVDLRVYGNGQTRSVKVKTVDPDSLYENDRTSIWRRMDDRPTLGMGIASTGSKRDTLGVFVISVDEDGPAAKAGIEEGARIAAINGVDLRVSREDAGDDFVSGTRLNRLEREMAKVKPGDAVELRYVQNGQTRTTKVTTVSVADLNRNSRSSRIIHGGNGVTIIRSPNAMRMEVDTERIGTTVRRAMEEAARATSSRIEDIGRVFDEMGRGFRTGGTIRWMSHETPAPGAPAVAPRRGTIRM